MSKAKQRPALSLVPSIGEVADGQDAYVASTYMRRLASSARRWWTFHGVPTTVELPGQRYAKLWDTFADHFHDAPAFAELLREYRELNVPRPGGYAAVFNDRFKSPRVAWSVNAMLAPAFAGGWQAALKTGIIRGTHYKYDLRSAYLWAGSLGLPDTRTYRRSLAVSADRPGVYRVTLERPVPDAPFPFNRARECLASSEEIEVYSLPVSRVVSGVTWKRTLDPARMLDTIKLVTCWKQAGRSYWGRWGQTARVECHAGGKAWVLPNIAANVPWAHLIVSRVKMRLWTFATDAAHVYVDSVITPRRIPTGPEIGDWKLEATYPNGVLVRGPGQYGDPNARTLDRMAGVPKDSPLRSVALAG